MPLPDDGWVAGATVLVHGLKLAPQHNGKTGTLLGQQHNGREKIAMPGGEGLLIRRDHLMLTAVPAKAAAAEALESPPVLPASWHSFGQRVGLNVWHVAHETLRSPRIEASPPREVDTTVAARKVDRLRRLGFVTLRGDDRLAALARALERGIDALEASGLPACFLLCFDETWDVVRRLCSAAAPLLCAPHDEVSGGARARIGDIFVDVAGPGSSGWPPRRGDAVRPSSGASLSENLGGPRSPDMAAALWFSLGDMSPQTRCIYALPAHADPAFGCDLGSRAASCQSGSPDADATDVSDGFWSSAGTAPVDATLPWRQQQLQHVRALPLGCGDALLCSHRLLHWVSAHHGEASDEEASEDASVDGRRARGSGGRVNRISALGLTVRAARAPREVHPTPSLLRWPDLDPPPLEARLALVALRLLTQSSAEAAEAAGGEADAAEAEAPMRADHPLLPAILGLLQGHAEHLSSAALEVESHEALQGGSERLQGGEVESHEPRGECLAGGRRPLDRCVGQSGGGSRSDENVSIGAALQRRLVSLCEPPTPVAGGDGVVTAAGEAAIAVTAADRRSAGPRSTLPIVTKLAGTIAHYIASQRDLAVLPDLARVARRFESRWRSLAVPEPVKEAAAGQMSAAALHAALSEPHEPIVFRGGWTAERAAAFRAEFEDYARRSTTEWQTLGAGRQRLSVAWATPGVRLEHALDSVPDGFARPGPLDDLFSGPVVGSATAEAAETVHKMRAAAIAAERAIQREPVFVTAPSPPAETNGCEEAVHKARGQESASVALTHFDEYLNLALHLIGRKRWYLLAPSNLRWEDGPKSHSPNERLDVSLESHPELPWRVADLGPGDLLVLPSGWWHRVVSESKGSLLFNLWTD